jgi:hypothetical protein
MNFSIPLGESFEVRIVDKKFGRHSNIYVTAKTLDTEEEFVFSVWFDQCYKPRDGKISFRPDSIIGKRLEVLFKKTKNGYLDIQKAKVLPYQKEEIEAIKVGDIVYGEWDCGEYFVYQAEIEKIFLCSTSYDELIDMGYTDSYAKTILEKIKYKDLKYLAIENECPIPRAMTNESSHYELELNSLLEDI